MLKKALSLLMAGFMLLCPLMAQADQTLAFTLAGEIDPAAVSEDHRELAQGLADGLKAMTLQGDITYNDQWMFDLNGEILVGGQPYVNGHAQSNSRWITFTTNLFGAERVALMMQVYLEFAMKPYNYMGLPMQYLALLTSRYAHTSAWEPVLAMCRPVLGGEGDRTVSTRELMALARQIAAYTEESREMRYWIIALLMDLGGDEVMNEMLLTLPEWIEEAAGEEGLVITARGDTETWVLGGETVFEITRGANGHAQWRLALSREGYQVSARAAWGENGSLDAGADITLHGAPEGEENVFSLAIHGIGLPDGQAASQAELSLHMGGTLLPQPLSFRFDGNWETDAQGTVQAQLRWLDADSGSPKATLRGAFTPVETREGLLTFTNADLENGATNAFTLHDETLRDFVSRVKESVAQVAMPLFLALPASFSLSVLDWLEETGFTALLTDGLE